MVIAPRGLYRQYIQKSSSGAGESADHKTRLLTAASRQVNVFFVGEPTNVFRSAGRRVLVGRCVIGTG